MENVFLALQVVGLGVGPITATSSFVQNQPRLAARAYSLDSSQFTYVNLDICTFISSNKTLLC